MTVTYASQKATVSASQSLAPSDGKGFADGHLPKWMRPKPTAAAVEEVEVVNLTTEALKKFEEEQERQMKEEERKRQIELEKQRKLELERQKKLEMERQEMERKQKNKQRLSVDHMPEMQLLEIPAEFRDPKNLEKLLEQHTMYKPVESKPSPPQDFNQFLQGIEADWRGETLKPPPPPPPPPERRRELTMFEKFSKKINLRRIFGYKVHNPPEVSLDEQLYTQPKRPPAKHFWKNGFFRIRQKVAAYREKQQKAEARGQLAAPSFAVTELGRDAPDEKPIARMFQSVKEKFTSFAETASEAGSFNIKSSKSPKLPANPFRKKMQQQNAPAPAPKIAPKKVFGFGSSAPTAPVRPAPGKVTAKSPPPATSSFSRNGEVSVYTSQAVFTLEEHVEEDLTVTEIGTETA